MNCSTSNHVPFPSPVQFSSPSGLHSPSTTPTPSRRTLWIDSRLRRHADYQRVYAVARKHFSASIAWFAAMRQESASAACNAPARVGLTVGKALGKAHERNRIKRRLRAAIRAHRALLPHGLDIVLHPRRSALSDDFSAITAEIEKTFSAAAEFAKNRPGMLLKKTTETPSGLTASPRMNSATSQNALPRRRGVRR